MSSGWTRVPVRYSYEYEQNWSRGGLLKPGPQIIETRQMFEPRETRELDACCHIPVV